MALWLDYNRRSLGIYHTCTLGPIILSLEVKAMLLFCNKSGRRDIRIPPSSIPENEAYFFMKVFCCVLYVDSCMYTAVFIDCAELNRWLFDLYL